MPPKSLKKSSSVAVGGAGAASPFTALETLYFQHVADYVAKYGARTAVLMQVGKFFEVYDSIDVRTGASRANAISVVEACEVAVDPKPTDDPLRQKVFWGFPETSLPKFERMLVAKGYTVVVLVQTKDSAGDVTGRTVDHISSPGTFWDVEGGLAVRKEEQILLGLYIEPYMDSERRMPHWYIASTAFDVMTGKAVSTETDLTVLDGKPVYDPIAPFWSVYPPAEVVVWWSSTTLAPPSVKHIQSLFGTSVPPVVHCIQLDPKKETGIAEDRKRLAFLTDIYRPESALNIAEYLGIERHPFVRRSLALLLGFLKDHNPSYLTNLHDHTLWCPDSYCLLGNSALEQLAMLPLNPARPQESLLHWLQKTTTSMGARALRERCLKPLTDCEALEERQERIAALREDPGARAELEATLKGAFDLPRLYRRIQLGTATTDDLLQLLVTYKKAQVLLKETEATMYGVQDCEVAALLQEHLSTVLSIWDEERIRAAKQAAVGGGEAVVLGSCHPWRRGVHADLDAFEDAWRTMEAAVLAHKSRWEEILEEDRAIDWTLREDAPFTFTTTARRAANLTTLAKTRLKQDITHTKRGASTTVVLDSVEISRANAEGTALRGAWRAAVNAAWRADWSAWTATALASGVLEALVDFLATLDVDCTLARIADEYGYVRPTYVASTEEAIAGFAVRDLRHPILERISNTPYIPHTLAYGAFCNTPGFEGDARTPGGLLVYGVNAAGKSSLGKALGLAVLLAQCGIPVPASDMRIIPYTGLFTRILGNDNLWAGMSSFVVEMTEFRSILRAAGPRTLVLGDELCAGTETASATSIVAAGVQTLCKRGTHFYFATHLHELASLPEISNTSSPVRMVHLSVHATAAGVLVYDRILRAGCGSPMYGLEVCRGLDMDAEFLRLAFAYRKRLFDTPDGGAGSALEAHASRYNPAVLMNACGVCGARSALETHHIVPQAAADSASRISPGVHKNADSNLVVLCDGCHTAHHRGVLEIQGWVDTTAGRKLQYVRH